MQFYYTEDSKVGDTSYYVPSPKSGGHVPTPSWVVPMVVIHDGWLVGRL